MRVTQIAAASFVSLFALAAGGCTDRLVEAPPLGGSVVQNNMAQIVDPKPESIEEPPPLNGERNNAAQTRYEKGRIIKPVDTNTNSTSSGSGGGSK
jgi:hypothetical protein